MIAAIAALAVAAAPAPAAFSSIEGGEPLGVGNTVLAMAAGFPRLSVTWAQGTSEATDLGALLDLDWATTEILLGGMFRTLVWRSGATTVALRARAGIYGDFGATWIYGSNRGDTGLQLSPGAALSWRTAPGLLSIGAEVPLTVTFERGGGYAVGLRGGAAFETPLWGDLTAGARFGGGVVGYGSGAPLARESPRGFFELSALLTYKLL